ncbi:uncharacterized protein LOC131875999 [Cryptomeria japonica]|uniref:uncharacterized protein LOC131875999 n=1 Tax=Cryptomeria japonica TaxID=3369 RepID=UPI0027DA8324|nr:uncharacterized protein LOC131875999 [Cryptomeria japonica]
MHIHIPKDKRTKLEPSDKKGIFVGYSETSKAYKIYIPWQKLIELSRDVTFEEAVAFRKSKGIHEMDSEDQEPLQNMEDDHTPEIHRETHELEEDDDPNELLNPTDGPPDIVIGKKRPLWARKMKQEAEIFATPRGTFRESKRPHKFFSYVALMSQIIESVEEATIQ